MSLNSQIENLWNTKDPKGISEVLYELLQLLKKADDNNEEVPLDLMLDIICNANYVLEFGKNKNEFKYVLKQWVKSKDYFNSIDDSSDLSDKELSTIDKIYRLSSILTQLYLGNIMFDSQQKQTLTIDSFQEQIPLAKDLLSQIEYLEENFFRLIMKEPVTYWKFMCISDYITLFCMVKEQGKLDSDKLNKFDDINKVFTSSNDLINGWIKDWKEKIILNSDTFRFLYLMIFNDHPDENIWINKAKSLIEA
jgi:hypothetical protein